MKSRRSRRIIAAPMNGSSGDLALVLGGGGARAAYQVGFLRALGHMFPELDVPILTGVSAGAISAAFLANHPGQFIEAVDDLAKAWEQLTVDKVFRAGSLSLANHAARWGVRLVSGGSKLGPRTHGLVDTSPLREYLHGMLKSSDGRLPNVADKIASGRLKSLAITTTRYSNNQSISWVQSKERRDWIRPQRKSTRDEITISHVMASSALPIFFPAIDIHGEWHGDGGVSLTAPLAPALHLGANRLIAISTRYERTQVEADGHPDASYPSPAAVIGVLLSAVFLDMLDYDAMNMQRINELVRMLPVEKRGELREARLLLHRPSTDISKLAAHYEPALPGVFRFLMRGMGTRESKSPDSLSMVLFEPAYMRSLIEIGESDAWNHRDDIQAFMQGEDRPSLARTGFWRI